jgi:hypothetical protein
MAQVAGILLEYYDKGYRHQLSARDPDSIRSLEVPEGATAAEIAKIVKSLFL